MYYEIICMYYEVIRIYEEVCKYYELTNFEALVKIKNTTRSHFNMYTYHHNSHWGRQLLWSSIRYAPDILVTHILLKIVS